MQHLSNETLSNYCYALSKQLTAMNSAAVSDELQGIIQSGCQCLILDGSRVEEVDIAGLNLLIKVYKWMMALNGSMVLQLKKNGKLAAMLHLTKYDRWFQLKYTE
ncbi:STAS domain-containing protein [Chitinophaga sp.]|uniref:STAS domain-containing protein n=1 Tax=Chitinophaga sp. TaxID=1869181 RepID=UPI0031D54046